jgi:hypothetical protein
MIGDSAWQDRGFGLGAQSAERKGWFVDGFRGLALARSGRVMGAIIGTCNGTYYDLPKTDPSAVPLNAAVPQT